MRGFWKAGACSGAFPRSWRMPDGVSRHCSPWRWFSAREKLRPLPAPPSRIVSPCTAARASRARASSPAEAGTGPLDVSDESPERPETLKAPDAATGLAQARTTTRAETKRLIQEIEVLRENLEHFQQRDRALFETVPGRAWPIVMTMSPPGVPIEETQPQSLLDDPSRLTTMLGDALAMSHRSAMAAAAAPDDVVPDATAAPPFADPLASGTPPAPTYPSAIPIYDAARDAGTLVVNNLAPAPRGEAYNLWVTTEKGSSPIFVGSLPMGENMVADSFDFSLGSNLVLPTGFLLTRDPLRAPTRPNSENTVLQGPPTGKS